MDTYVARLLDQEGRVVMGDLVVEANHWGPPQALKMATGPRFSGRALDEELAEPKAVACKTITFTLERQAGDGVLIYRRTSPLWD